MTVQTSSDQMRELGLRLYREVFEHGKLAVADDLVALDCGDMSPRLPAGVVRTGPEALKQLATLLRVGLPDLCVRVHEMHVDGATIITRITLEGMHEGDLLGMEPTGRWIAWDAIDILRVRGGRIRERYGLWDEVGLWQQLSERRVHEQSEV